MLEINKNIWIAFKSHKKILNIYQFKKTVEKRLLPAFLFKCKKSEKPTLENFPK